MKINPIGQLWQALPLRKKLQLSIAVPSFLILLVAICLIFGLQWQTFRQDLVTDLVDHANSLASQSAKVMNQPDMIKEVWIPGIFMETGQIRSVGIYYAGGSPFFVNSPGDPTRHPRFRPDLGNVSFLDNEVIVTRPVVSDGETIGHIQITSGLSGLYPSVWEAAVGLTIICLLSLILSFILSKVVSYYMVSPIEELLSKTNGIRPDIRTEPRIGKGSIKEMEELVDEFGRTLVELGEKSEELQKSERRAAMLFKNAPVALVELDLSMVKKSLDGAMLTNSESLDEYLMKNPKELLNLSSLVAVGEVNRTLTDLFRRIESEPGSQIETALASQMLYDFRNLLLNLLSDKETFEIPVKQLQFGDRAIYIRVSATLLPDSQHDWSCLLISLTDITRLKQVEQALRNTSKNLKQSMQSLTSVQAAAIANEKYVVLGNLTARICHELNNPLMGILNYVQFGKEESDNPDVHETLELAEKEVYKTCEIVNQMRWVHHGPGKSMEPLDVNSLLQKAAKLFGKSILLSKAEVSIQIEDGLPEIRSDADLLYQVLINLILNSEHAMEACPVQKLVLKANIEEDSLCIRVIDTGTGIKSEVADQMFGEFFTTKPLGQSTGLGLTVSLRIVTNLGGSLALESTGEKGTTLKVLIPLSGPVQDRKLWDDLPAMSQFTSKEAVGGYSDN